MKKAILFGASGFVGSYLLEELLSNPDYDQVTVVVRTKLSRAHPKLKILIGDYHSLPGLQSEIVGDDVFIAIGTTKKKTPDPKAYYEIDHDYPVLAAKISKESGAKSVFIVSSVGADDQSGFFYLKTKGELERNLLALNFNHTHIFRPSMITGNRAEHRSLEKSLVNVWSVVDFFLIGKLKNYRGINGRDIAKAMNTAAKAPVGKVKISHWQEMCDLLS